VAQVNVVVPTGLRAGRVYVSLAYTSRGESNADSMTVVGPSISGDGIATSNYWVRDDMLTGNYTAIYGQFASTNTVYMECGSSLARTSVSVAYTSSTQINILIPSGLADGTRCGVTVNSGTIESLPSYVIINARANYNKSVGVYHWGHLTIR